MTYLPSCQRACFGGSALVEFPFPRGEEGDCEGARGRAPGVAFARRREAVASVVLAVPVDGFPGWGGESEDRPGCLCSSRLLMELAGMETPSW